MHLNSSGQVVRAAVLCVTGDNLGSNSVAGFTENFGVPKSFCRFCLISRDQISDMNSSFPSRTVENYNMAVQCLRNGEGHAYVLKTDSIFNSLRHIHVCDLCLPPCLGYDLFEGTVSYDLKVCLRYFIKNKKWFSYTQLDKQIRQFKVQMLVQPLQRSIRLAIRLMDWQQKIGVFYGFFQ